MRDKHGSRQNREQNKDYECDSHRVGSFRGGTQALMSAYRGPFA